MGFREKERLTAERIRQFKGFENVSDIEAENIIDIVEKFSYLMYGSYLKSKELKGESKKKW
jgi:hypothetical protein